MDNHKYINMKGKFGEVKYVYLPINGKDFILYRFVVNN